MPVSVSVLHRGFLTKIGLRLTKGENPKKARFPIWDRKPRAMRILGEQVKQNLQIRGKPNEKGMLLRSCVITVFHTKLGFRVDEILT